jgi:hypothetical protein
MADLAGQGRHHTPGTIPATAVKAAVRLAETYLVPHAIRAFGLMAADPAEALAQRVVRWLTRNPEITRFTRNEAFKGLKGGQSDLKSDDLAPAIDVLVAHGYIRQAPQVPGPGRPAEAFEINPTWNRSDSGKSSPESPKNTLAEIISRDLGDVIQESDLPECDARDTDDPHADESWDGRW